jgi:cytochrome b561
MSDRYDSVQIGLHWLISILIAIAIIDIWICNSLERGPLRTTLFFVHRSFGTTVFALSIVRLGWRLTHVVPPPPASIPSWQQRAGSATHWLLYALLFVMPITGYLSSALLGHTVSYFYLFDLPALAEDKPTAKLFGAIHETLQWAVYALIVLHAAAAFRHQFILGDGLLRRMLPGGGAAARAAR